MTKLIRRIFQVIWDGKWLIAVLSALIILPAFALAFIYEPNKRASITLLPLSDTQMSFYSGLNSTQLNPVTAGRFQDTFFREFYRRELAQEIISEYDPRILEFEGTESEKIAAVASVVEGAFSIEISESAEVLEPTLLSFVAKDAVKARNILKAIVTGLNKRTLEIEIAKINNARSTKQRNLDFEIRKTEVEIDNSLDDYETRITARKVYLSEQLAIAKTLGIAENGFSDLLSKGSITGISGQNSLPFYMRGSKAIGKELSLLEARSNSREEALWHVDKYPELRAKLLALRTDLSIANFDKEFANSPFANDNEKIMNYDLNSIIVVSAHSKLLILIVISILAGILATIFVIIRHFILIRNTQAAG